jgi:hypothetical protein
MLPGLAPYLKADTIRMLESRHNSLANASQTL